MESLISNFLARFVLPAVAFSWIAIFGFWSIFDWPVGTAIEKCLSLQVIGVPFFVLAVSWFLGALSTYDHVRLAMPMDDPWPSATRCFRRILSLLSFSTIAAALHLVIVQERAPKGTCAITFVAALILSDLIHRYWGSGVSQGFGKGPRSK